MVAASLSRVLGAGDTALSLADGMTLTLDIRPAERPVHTAEGAAELPGAWRVPVPTVVLEGEWRWPDGGTDAFYDAYEADPRTLDDVAQIIEDMLVGGVGAREMFFGEGASLYLWLASRDPNHPDDSVRGEVRERGEMGASD